MTSRQASFLSSLMAREAVKLAADPDDLDTRSASVLIDNLLQRSRARKAGGRLPSLHPDFQPTGEAPAPEPERKPFPRVPAGHYATTSATGSNDLDFWAVDVPEDGRWKGYQFIRRVIGGRPDQNIRGQQARAALEAIVAEGIDATRTRYGQEIGRCWKCNRHLTDDLSRSRGIGPDCYAEVYGA